MSPRLKLYVGLMVAVATALLWYVTPHEAPARWAHYAAWVAICAISESLWLGTLSGQGTVTMASTAGLAAAALWGPGASMWITAASTVLAESLVLRKPWVRVLFNASQITVTMWAAAGIFVLLGGPASGLESVPMGTGELTAARLVTPFLGLFLTYLFVNRALVAVAVSWSTDRPYLRVLREDWFYTERLLEDAAAFLLSPLMVISFKSIGYAGVVLFYAPLRIINESHRRYLELKGTQQQLIHNERMAAKGEMAAEIGHELRNQLVAISGRAQMLMKDSEREVFTNVPRHAQIILEQSKRMEALSNGLMGFSRAELNVERVDLNALMHRSIEFVRAQNRFDGVEWDVRLAEPSPQLRADPGQLQQVLLNLFMNAADAMKDNNGKARLITVTTEMQNEGKQLRLDVVDTGSGITPGNLARIFEPKFTTKTTGNGFGLSTSYRIVTNHGGRMEVESMPGQGARFLVTLPLQGPGGWN